MEEDKSFANGNGNFIAGVPGKRPDQSIIDARQVTTTFFEMI